MKYILVLLTAVALVTLGAPVRAAVNDFTITNYDIEYTLGRDDEQRSTLRTVETITAEFPESNQNHGIERAIPKTYDGHKTSLKIESVKKADGSDWNYEDSTSNDNLVLRIGDADTYLHGAQTFVITYTQRDVTRYFSSTDSDEFYWDTNGADWRVPIERLSVTLNADPGLMPKFTGDVSCYEGGFGANATCEIERNNNTFSVQATDLMAGENVTVALGFEPRTFGAYEKSFADKVVEWWLASLFVLGAIALIPIVWIVAVGHRWQNRRNELGTIVPQYLPPADASIGTSASIVSNLRAAFGAQLLDLAVRHYLKIYQVKEKSLFRAAEYEIEIVRDISDLKAEEREILADIFSTTTVGSKLALKDLKNNSSVYEKTIDNEDKLNRLVEQDYGIRHVDPARRSTLRKAGAWLLVPAVIFLNPVFLVASILAFSTAQVLRPLTDKGLDLYRYLEGLKLYISVAEAERIAMLQSPEGAAKVGVAVDGSDPKQLVKLYERVLPYAVLFGQEKEWNKRIGSLYEASGGQPDWYGGNTVFNAAVFGSAMSSFSSAATYSPPSSSSSGGSGGGGFSGGGGGGGGGGGW